MANAPDWGLWDLFLWKAVPEGLGGGRGHIQTYKDGWVRHNRLLILAAAARHRLPAPLVAGVCWIEVGGDPTFVDQIAYAVRAIDWSGPDFIDRFTITRRPETTSFGPVSMQLRTAAATLGLDAAKMTPRQWSQLATALEKDGYNIDLAARHLADLLDRDGAGRERPKLNRDEVKVLGARYNRGASLSIERIRRNTSYGDLIVKLWPRFTELLK